MITGIHPNVIHFLNSKITKWYFPKISSDLGRGSRYFKQFVELLPVPSVSENQNFYDTLTSDNVDEALTRLYYLQQREIRTINQ